ncbi:hypothetical protein RCL1_005937 [Eukaryota sp. TZLM3-RCL]
MSEKKKKIIKPSERILLIVKYFIFGNQGASTLAAGLLLLIILALGAAASFYAVWTKFKLLSFLSFCYGCLFSLFWIKYPSLINDTIDGLFKSAWPLGIVTVIAMAVLGLFTIGNALWFSGWLGGLFIWSFTQPFKIQAFEYFAIPCLIGTGTCHFYKDVPYGKFTGDFWYYFAMWMSIPLPAAAGLFYFIIIPVIALLQLLKGALTFESKYFFSDEYTSEDPSKLKVLFYYITGVSAAGAVNWVIVLGMPVIWLFVYSLTWPDFTVRSIIRIVLAGIGIVVPVIALNSKEKISNLFDVIKQGFPIVSTFWTYIVVTIVFAVPFVFAYTGYLISILYLLMESSASRVLFITRERVGNDFPTFVTLLLSFLNCFVFLSLFLILFFLFKEIFSCVKRKIEGYKEFEQEYIQSREQKQVETYC